MIRYTQHNIPVIILVGLYRILSTVHNICNLPARNINLNLLCSNKVFGPTITKIIKHHTRLSRTSVLITGSLGNINLVATIKNANLERAARNVFASKHPVTHLGLYAMYKIMEAPKTSLSCCKPPRGP